MCSPLGCVKCDNSTLTDQAASFYLFLPLLSNMYCTPTPPNGALTSPAGLPRPPFPGKLAVICQEKCINFYKFFSTKRGSKEKLRHGVESKYFTGIVVNPVRGLPNAIKLPPEKTTPLKIVREVTSYKKSSPKREKFS